jgi:hypothetical protein
MTFGERIAPEDSRRRPRSPAARSTPEGLSDPLLGGDVVVARRLLFDAFAAGRPLAELGDEIVAPAIDVCQDDYPRLIEATRTCPAGIIVGGQGVTPELQHGLVAAAFGTWRT